MLYYLYWQCRNTATTQRLTNQVRRYKVKQTPSDRPSVYQVVTDRIIASLKEGIIPWEKPWKAPTFAAGSFPRNFVTGKPYRGVNVFLLWGTRFSSPILAYVQTGP